MASPQCTLVLNNQALTFLTCNGRQYLAFSGNGRGRNNPADASVPGKGPIPPGTYYAVAHPKGGRLQGVEDYVRDVLDDTDRAKWFGLYSTTSRTDFMTTKGVRRGNFRLHPAGDLGISDGCITLVQRNDFDQLYTYLHSQTPLTIPGTNVQYFATVLVR